MFFPPMLAEVPPNPRDKMDPPAVVRPVEQEVLDHRSAVGAAIRAIASPYADCFEPIVKEVKARVGQLRDQINPPLTHEEQAAAKLMHKMLEPQKLGGADRTLNHRDVAAVGRGIRDGGITGTLARRAVPMRMARELTKAGVVADPQAQPDNTRRSVTTKELKEFGAAGEVIRGRAEFIEKLGFKVVFPNGISQDAIQHTLDRRFGLPPGATLVPAKPDSE